MRTVLMSMLFLAFFFYRSYSTDLLLFKPLTANIYEPRIGANYQIENEKLRLDIGASYDFYRKIYGDNKAFSAGVDFFTYSLLRTESNFKFPVETSDYFFGLNLSIVDSLFNNPFSSRLRVSHISSHLVDGYSDEGVFTSKPFTFSKEFIDLVLSTQIKFVRYYIGANVVFSSVPNDIEKVIIQLGMDTDFPIDSALYLVFGADLKFAGNKMMNSYQLGLLLKTFENVGFMLNLNYYKGRNFHNMFHDFFDKYYSIGFQIVYY